MSSADPPPVRVVLPDGQELRGPLHERRQFARGGWMFWVGLPMWSNDPEAEGVGPSEYRVWLTVDQARPLEGVSYDEVPTHSLPAGAPAPEREDRARWAWKARRMPAREGRPGSVVVHVWDCQDAGDGEELDLDEAGNGSSPSPQ